jgi:adenylate kinase
MDVDFEILMKRLTGRRTCSKTGAVLNIYFSSPAELEPARKRAASCCNERTTTKRRSATDLKVYQRETAPLIDLYTKRGMLKTVAATAKSTQSIRASSPRSG